MYVFLILVILILNYSVGHIGPVVFHFLGEAASASISRLF